MTKQGNNLSKLAVKVAGEVKKRAEDRLSVFEEGGPTAGADWGGCAAESIQAVVVGVTVLGGAVTFGTSRDQGAHSVTLLLDEKRKTLWVGANEDLDEKLEAVAATLETLA